MSGDSHCHTLTSDHRDGFRRRQSIGDHKELKLQLVQKQVKVARPQYTRIVMPSRDGPKHSACDVGPKARLHPDSPAVGVPRIESLLRICILLSSHSARPIAVWTRVCNIAVIDRIINECKCIPRQKLQSLNHNKSTVNELAKMIALKIPLDRTCKSRELVYDLGCAFRCLFRILPGVIFRNPPNSAAFRDSVGTHVGIK
jgi:hypothetical protein